MINLCLSALDNAGARFLVTSLPEGKSRVAEIIELTDIRVKGDNDVSTKCDYINNCLSKERQ